MQRKIRIFTMALVLALSVCSMAMFVSCTKKPVENVTVTVSQKEIQLEVGKSEKLTVKVEPADAMDKTVEWKSSDESVATVKDGLVTAVAEGSAVITVKTNQKSDTCKVTVKAAGENPPASSGSDTGSSSDKNSSDSGNGSDSAQDSAKGNR